MLAASREEHSNSMAGKYISATMPKLLSLLVIIDNADVVVILKNTGRASSGLACRSRHFDLVGCKDRDHQNSN